MASLIWSTPVELALSPEGLPLLRSAPRLPVNGALAKHRISVIPNAVRNLSSIP